MARASTVLFLKSKGRVVSRGQRGGKALVSAAVRGEWVRGKKTRRGTKGGLCWARPGFAGSGGGGGDRQGNLQRGPVEGIKTQYNEKNSAEEDCQNPPANHAGGGERKWGPYGNHRKWRSQKGIPKGHRERTPKETRNARPEDGPGKTLHDGPLLPGDLKKKKTRAKTEAQGPGKKAKKLVREGTFFLFQVHQSR